VILCVKTEIIDKAKEDLFAQKIIVEDTTICYVINTEKLNLCKTASYPQVGKDPQRLSFSEFGLGVISSKLLSLTQAIILKVL